MILVLTFIALIVLAIGFACLGTALDARGNDGYEFCGGAAITCGFIGLAGAIITGLWCIIVNIPSNAKSEAFKLQETIRYYENERNIITSFHTITDGNKTEFTSDITLETISTTQYYTRVDNFNEKVFNFKVDVVAHKNRRTNPWLSWFESYAWDTITTEMLDNLTYTTGK